MTKVALTALDRNPIKVIELADIHRGMKLAQKCQ